MTYKHLISNAGLIASLSCLLPALADVNTPPPKDIVRGKIQSINQDSLKLTTQSGVLAIKITSPLTVYESHPASLSQVKSSSFVGVSSVKQPNGSQQAT